MYDELTKENYPDNRIAGSSASPIPPGPQGSLNTVLVNETFGDEPEEPANSTPIQNQTGEVVLVIVLLRVDWDKSPNMIVACSPSADPISAGDFIAVFTSTVMWGSDGRKTISFFAPKDYYWAISYGGISGSDATLIQYTNCKLS
jgi:hypothetical protein